MMRWSPALSPRPGCPHRRLRHLLTQALSTGLALGASTFRPWASANFIGARHILTVIVAVGDAAAVAAALQADLTANEWALSGHIVADVVVECGSESGTLRIEILTVED